MRLISPARSTLVLVVTAVVFASGCAQSREVQLNPPAAPLGVANVGAGRSITIARPLDARPNAGAIGAWFGDMGQVVAAARPRNDPAVWIADAFVSGLENAGYRVYRSETAEQTVTPVVLVITVNEAYTKFYLSGWSTFSGQARVVVQIEAFRGGSRILKRSYSGASSKDYALSEARNPTFATGPSADQYKQSLQDAMQNMLEKAISNLASALAEKGA